MKVLSLCDGISCGQMALEKLGIEVEKYYASEIKSIAISTTKTNFPNTIHIGDVNKISYSNGVLHTENGDFEETFDLVIFGSPCQSFSRAMRIEKRVGLEDKERSGLFLECHRILKEVKPTYFLMENVIMKKENQDIISEMMGVQPIRINSKFITAQSRERLYWTNIPIVRELEEKFIAVNEILKDGYYPFDKARCLMKNDSHGYYNGCNWTSIKRFHRWHNTGFGTIIFHSKEQYEKALEEHNKILNGRKPMASLFDNYVGDTFDCMRYLWKEERARLQTIPEKYVQCMSEKDAADLIGDGWTVDVIAYLFEGLK